MAVADFDCQACGACCACYRVDFSVLELLSEGGTVPDGLSLPLTASLVRMRGTDHIPPRCAALTGRIGQQVACGIYEWRPSPCRELQAVTPVCKRVGRPIPPCLEPTQCFDKTPLI